ncbi:MAG: hypothetical protein R2851_05095 [Caldilineaceae bacterium]
MARSECDLVARAGNGRSLVTGHRLRRPDGRHHGHRPGLARGDAVAALHAGRPLPLPYLARVEAVHGDAIVQRGGSVPIAGPRLLWWHEEDPAASSGPWPRSSCWPAT